MPITAFKFPPVLTKHDFVRRYKAGEFGNASPTWDNYNHGMIGYNYFHIRNRIAGGPTFYNLHWSKLENKWHELMEAGVPAESLYISAMAPHDKNLIQGEVHQGPKGLTLFYSTLVGKPMREVLAERAEEVTGIIAVSLLRLFMCPNSYEWLQVLLDRYPGHVVEFSTFSVCWGTIEGFNTVYWEVRNY